MVKEEMLDEESSNDIQEVDYGYDMGAGMGMKNKDGKEFMSEDRYDHQSEDQPYLQRQYHTHEGGSEPQPGPSLLQGVSFANVPALKLFYLQVGCSVE